LNLRLHPPTKPHAPDLQRATPRRVVAYRDHRAVGWVNLAPREDYERLVTSKILAPLDDVPVWSIVCPERHSTVRPIVRLAL
jgi:hypothetical protein